MTNDAIQYWVRFIEREVSTRNIFMLNRFMTPLLQKNRLNENQSSLLFGREWDIARWEFEPDFERCPYNEITANPNLLLIAKWNKMRFIVFNPSNPLMIELNMAVLGLFLAHMHNRYHESSKTQKNIVLRQNSSKKLHFVLRSSINAHLKGLFFIISFGNTIESKIQIRKSHNLDLIN